MINEPTELELSKLPPLYGTEQIETQDKIVHLKFFLGSWTWYAVEYSPEERLFFGFIESGLGPDCSEWGYFSFDDLLQVKAPLTPGGPGVLETDRDMHWEPRAVKDIPELAGRAC
jgi:hypothetical protein